MVSLLSKQIFLAGKETQTMEGNYFSPDTCQIWPKNEPVKWVYFYLISASSRLFTTSQFTIFQKASTNLGLSFL
jgi:hypothetical protein